MGTIVRVAPLEKTIAREGLMASMTISRRQFVGSGLAFAGCSVFRTSGQAAPPPKRDAPATHNWMLVGGQTAFLSHLPMFDHLNESGSEYVTPHRYQVILQASFKRDTTDSTGIYFADRKNHPATKMFTVSPTQDFVLPDVAANQPLTSFTGTVFRGHLERGGKPISKLDDVTVTADRVIHFHKFDPAVNAPDALEYFVFGRGKELFLAHSILKPPDFDQILSVEVSGADMPDEVLSSAVRVQISDRKNSSSDRIQEKQQVTGETSTGTKLTIRAIREFYFEEGELRMPATFRPTPEEIKAGFAD
jgi:hypothetical protein